MKWSEREVEPAVAIVTAVALPGVLFLHISVGWLFAPMVLAGWLMYLRKSGK